MIIILKPDVASDGPEIQELLTRASRYPNVVAKTHTYRGETHVLTEVHLIGETKVVPTDAFSEHPAVVRVVRVSEKYRILGRHDGQVEAVGFEYRGIRFAQDTFHVFPGLSRSTSRQRRQDLRRHRRVRRQDRPHGRVQPRTSPYDFQGHGKACLPHVFDPPSATASRSSPWRSRARATSTRSATRWERRQPDRRHAPIGTRNAQNFELLKAAGQQKDFPVLYKRGMGISLEEALNACEYIASEGNSDIVFCLRGVKTHLGAPHRNMIDFAHVPVVKRLTRLPVCVDPSHSAGRRSFAADGISDIHNATAEGVVLGANMVLVDFHPEPQKAMCDGPQALTLEELPAYLEDVRLVRETYLRRVALAKVSRPSA